MARTPEELDAALERAYRRSERPIDAPSPMDDVPGGVLVLAIGALVLVKLGVVPGIGPRSHAVSFLEVAGLVGGVVALAVLVTLGQRWLRQRRAAALQPAPLQRLKARRCIESPSHGVVFIVDDGLLGEQLPFLAFDSLAPISLDSAAYLEGEHGLLVRQRISAGAAAESRDEEQPLVEGTVDHRVRLPADVSPEKGLALARWLLQRTRVGEPGELGPPP